MDDVRFLGEEDLAQGGDEEKCSETLAVNWQCDVSCALFGKSLCESSAVRNHDGFVSDFNEMFC